MYNIFMDKLEKYKYLIFGIAVTVFSIPSYLIFYKYYDIVDYLNDNTFYMILCITNILLIMAIFTIHILFINESKKSSIVYSLILGVYYFIILLFIISFAFIDNNLNIIFEIINIPNFILSLLIGIILTSLFPLRIGYGVTALIFTIVYNIIFTLIFYNLKYKQSKYNKILLILYFLQCNSCLVFLFYAIKVMSST